MKPKIVIVLGPTASGKSDLAVKIAKQYNGEIISADSRQVYKGLDIGTGKVSRDKKFPKHDQVSATNYFHKGIPHHLLDVANPRTVFTADAFKKKGEKALGDIVKRKKLPIVCGGTGLYIDSLLGSISWPEVPPNPTLRKKLEKKSTEELFKQLQVLDPKRAKTIDNKNPVRLIRAIEIATLLGKVPEQKRISIPYETLYIGLLPDPEILLKKIHLRLLTRIKDGMLTEVKKLHKEGLSWKRMESLGLEYRHVARHLQGFTTKQEMMAMLEKDIWHYSKRQMTWFKRNKDIHWFNPTKKPLPQITTLVQTFLVESKT